jgi:hypothetical protein
MDFNSILTIYLVVATLAFPALILHNYLEGFDATIGEIALFIFMSVLWPFTMMVFIILALEYFFTMQFWKKRVIAGRKKTQ